MQYFLAVLALAAVASAQDGNIYEGCDVTKRCFGAVPESTDDCIANEVNLQQIRAALSNVLCAF